MATRDEINKITKWIFCFSTLQNYDRQPSDRERVKYSLEIGDSTAQEVERRRSEDEAGEHGE